jgi:hypothetical protein
LTGEALIGRGSDIARLEARDETAPDIAAEPIDGVLERPDCVDAVV